MYLSLQGLWLLRVDRARLVPRASENDYRKNLIEIGEVARSIGSKILHMRPVVFTKTRLWEGGYSVDVPFVDTMRAFLESHQSPSELFIDGVHPSAAGHRIIAETLFRELQGSGVLDRCREGHDTLHGPMSLLAAPYPTHCEGKNFSNQR